MPLSTTAHVICTYACAREDFVAGRLGMLEKEIEKKFREKVKAAGGRAYKFTSPGNSGVPDRLVVLPGGRIGFIELKQTGKQPSKLQERQMEKLKDLGCRVSILDRTEDIDDVIEYIAANKETPNGV